MKWITNCPEWRVAEDIAALTLGHKTRRIIEGEPEATNTYTSEELKEMDIAGLWEVCP